MTLMCPTGYGHFGWDDNVNYRTSTLKWLNVRLRECLIQVLRESHAVILRDRVVPASQVPFSGEPSGEPGNGT